ncbi:MAG: DUF4397 domain-containing protein [Gemmatimonadales bacterium]|nr:DUF4397 domain-containing protein [Gemmatimonadales bacterium]
MRSKSNIWAGVMAGAVLVTAACDKARDTGAVTSTTASGTSTTPPSDVAEKHDQAFVRAVNALPGAKSVVIYAGDSTAFSNVAYKATTPWKRMPDDMFTFKVGRVGGSPDSALGDNHEKLGGGNHYTVIAFADEGGPNKANMRVLNDDLQPMTNGKARIRVVHTVANAPEISVYARGSKDAIFDGINFKSEAGWKDVDPMTGTLEIRPEGKNNVLATIPAVKLEAGMSYTYIITGTPAKLDVVKFRDSVMPTADDMKEMAHDSASMRDSMSMHRDSVRK